MHALKNQGWTNKEIADELGFHPATIAKWLKAGGPPGRVEVPDERRVMTERWRARVEALLAQHPRLLAVSIHNKLRAEGFAGSYPTVARAVRDVRGPRFRAAAAVSVPIHTDPGEEIQFDFCNLDHVSAEWGWEHPLRVFGAISSWPRQRMWWFTTSEDREHTSRASCAPSRPSAVCPPWPAPAAALRACGASCGARRAPDSCSLAPVPRWMADLPR